MTFFYSSVQKNLQFHLSTHAGLTEPSLSLTRSEFSFISWNTFWKFSVCTRPLAWISLRSAWASSTRLLRAAELRPVVRMLMSILPDSGSVADCLRASRCSLGWRRVLEWLDRMCVW